MGPTLFLGISFCTSALGSFYRFFVLKYFPAPVRLTQPPTSAAIHSALSFDFSPTTFVIIHYFNKFFMYIFIIHLSIK